MNDQLKIAQMNTKAVLAKLTEYEGRLAAQDKLIAQMSQRMVQLEQLVNQHVTTAAIVAQVGSGPTAER